jgi:hypothetical protein
MYPEIHYLNYGVTDASGRFVLPRCIGGTRSLSIHYDSGTPTGHSSNSENRRFELPAGETSTQDFGHDSVDIVGRLVVADRNEIDWSRSRLSLIPAEDGTDPLNLESVSYEALLEETGAFRLRNVRPVAGAIYGFITLQGDYRWTYEVEVPITPGMFAGKSATEPLDVGEIPVEDE